MRICIVTGIFPPDIGGPATYVPGISTALTARGHKVTVITWSDSLECDDAKWSFQVIRLRRSEARLLRMARTIRYIVQSAQQADVIFANGLFIESAFAARIARKPLAIKVVGDWAWERSVWRGWITDTIDLFQCHRYGVRVEGLKTLRSVAVRQASAVITPSNYLRGIVGGWGVPSERLHVIYNAQELDSKVETISLPSFEGPTVITVARLVPWKGIDRLLQVMRDLPEFRLLIVGDGPERNRLESLSAGLSLDGRVIFTGQVSKDSVLGYLRAADVFVLNSTYEGLPHIVLEAMQAGVPVIATDVGGTGEVVFDGETGLLVPVGDRNALIQSIIRLRQNPTLSDQIVTNAIQFLQTRFSHSTMVEQTEAVLAHVGK